MEGINSNIKMILIPSTFMRLQLSIGKWMLYLHYVRWEERLWIIKRDYVIWLETTLMKDYVTMLYLNIFHGVLFYIGHNPYSWWDLGPSTCCNCDSKMENLWHLFITCLLSKECWRRQRQGLWDQLHPLNIQPILLKIFSLIS